MLICVADSVSISPINWNKSLRPKWNGIEVPVTQADQKRFHPDPKTFFLQSKIKLSACMAIIEVPYCHTYLFLRSLQNSLCDKHVAIGNCSCCYGKHMSKDSYRVILKDKAFLVPTDHSFFSMLLESQCHFIFALLENNDRTEINALLHTPIYFLIAF